MLSALISSERGQPAVPLARQLAHQRFVRPGPLVLGAAPRKSPTPTTDRDRTVSRMLVPHCCGHRLYLHPVCRGRRVMRSLISQCEENLILSSSGRESRYGGTAHPCYADVARHPRRRSASTSNSLGSRNDRLRVRSRGI